MKSFVALLLALASFAATAQGPRQFELVYSFTFNGQYKEALPSAASLV